MATLTLPLRTIPRVGVLQIHAKVLVADLSGTVTHRYSALTIKMMQRALRDCGFNLSEEQIAREIGLPKKKHFERLLVDSQASKYGSHALEMAQIVDQHLTQQVAPKMLAENSAPFPEAVEGVALLRSRGWLITATTGFPRNCGEIVREELRKGGLTLDELVCSDEVVDPRPGPGGIHKILERLQVDSALVVKVGDTIADIKEGKSFRAHQVYGVTKYAPRLHPSIDHTEQLIEAGADRIYPTLQEVAMNLISNSR